MSKVNSVNPMFLIKSSWEQRQLIIALVKREVASRYRGSLLGNLWAIFIPLIMLAVYTFIFSMVFNARWGSGEGESRAEFALVLFAGLMVFNCFSECFVRAPRLILENVNYVKKVVFPLEVLPWVSLGAAVVNLSISLTVWLVFYCIVYGMPQVTVLLTPFILLPLLLLIIGLSWALAALGVYLRDLAQLVTVVSTMLMFLSPIFYPVEALPEDYRAVLNLNPLTPIIAQTRDVLYWGEIPSFSYYSTTLLASCLVAWGGFTLFQKTRQGFADVL
ncbi:MAG: ABC transporter permease [Pseudoalteromonas tetraodonis]|nr:ABC transporter permease [Pseudoalteromonas tetraodonis]